MASFWLDGKSFGFPVLKGSEGEHAIDITSLRKSTGFVSMDPGYSNTGSCKSAITFIDPDRGILKFRGIRLEELAEKSNFLETAYLLINGALPERSQFDEFNRGLASYMRLDDGVKRLYQGFPRDGHPMAVCGSVVAALPAFYPHCLDPLHAGQVKEAMYRLIGGFPAFAANASRHSRGQAFVDPVDGAGYTGNFLRLMFAPDGDYEIDETIASALDLILLVHADHEQNCSTSTVRLVGSSLSNLFASVSAGIGALWGPLHGGANQKVVEMLKSIEAGEGSAEKFVAQAKDRNVTSRLMGFGHPVYRTRDPRAELLKNAADKIFAKLGVHSRHLEIALKLEEIALNDDYFISRKLYPNLDFYSGTILEAIGIPLNMFTVVFAMGRLAGWIAQWVEMHADPDFKIGRPRQIYVGATDAPYVPLDRR